jgi:hypothetical protein
MPIVFGENVSTIDQCASAFNRLGDRVRGTYRARYVWEERSRDPYSATSTSLERPAALIENPPAIVFPWEQIFVAAATCAGSDYPMLAAHFGAPISRVELVVEGVFDPRGQFDGLAGFVAPPEAAKCYASLHLRATVTSRAPRELLEKVHARVVRHNMVLGALRGIPTTDELVIGGAS